MNQSTEIALLAKALIDFQSGQKPIVPNAVNPFLKNKYADLPALVEGTKDNLTKCKLAVSQLLNGRGVTTVLMHESGQFIYATAEIEPTESKGLNNAQTMGVAISYTRRYAYASILGLVTDEDTDGATTKKEQKYENKTQDKDQNKELINEICQQIIELADGDVKKAPPLLLKLTTFEGKDGNIVDGTNLTTDLYNYSTKRLQVLHGKLKTALSEKGESNGEY